MSKVEIRKFSGIGTYARDLSRGRIKIFELLLYVIILSAYHQILVNNFWIFEFRRAMHGLSSALTTVF